MSRIAKMNFWGIALSLSAILASSTFFLSCAPPAPTTNRPIGSIPQSTWSVTPAVPQATDGLLDLRQFDAAKINAALGTYTGTIVVEDEDHNPVDQDFQLTITRKVINGRELPEITFSSGNLRLQSLGQTQMSYGGYGTTIYFTSIPQSAPGIYEYGRVLSHAMIVLDYANQFDPISSEIHIADDGFLRDVVEFNHDWKKL